MAYFNRAEFWHRTGKNVWSEVLARKIEAKEIVSALKKLSQVRTDLGKFIDLLGVQMWVPSAGLSTAPVDFTKADGQHEGKGPRHDMFEDILPAAGGQ